jgi:hypothetical protein
MAELAEYSLIATYFHGDAKLKAETLDSFQW